MSEREEEGEGEMIIELNILHFVKFLREFAILHLRPVGV